MKQKRFVIILISTLFTLLLAWPISASAASNKCYVLSPSKNYSYNLDGKGKKETISYTITTQKQNYEDYNTVTVKVNNGVIYKKTAKYDDFAVIVTDVNTQDKQMELLIVQTDMSRIWWNGKMSGGFWGQGIKSIRYYTYSSGKVKFRQDLATVFKSKFAKKDVYTLHFYDEKTAFKVTGKGTIEMILCLQVGSEKNSYGGSQFDYQHIVRTLKLKNGKFTAVTKKEYTLQKYMPELYLSQNTKVLAKAGGKKVAYTIKKGGYMKVIGIYRTSKGKLYLKVSNKNKKTGYIDSNGKIYGDLIGTNHM